MATTAFLCAWHSNCHIYFLPLFSFLFPFHALVPFFSFFFMTPRVNLVDTERLSLISRRKPVMGLQRTRLDPSDMQILFMQVEAPPL